MKGFADIADLPEDKRIEVIGKRVNAGDVVAFFVDTEGENGMAKADRYIAKLLSWVPGLEVMHKDRFSEVPNTVLVKVKKL